jgi:PEP-CTERM motif
MDLLVCDVNCGEQQMKAKHPIAIAALVVGAFLGLKPAQATPIVWDFTPTTSGVLPTTKTYTSSPVLSPAENIIASGFSGTNTPVALYGKNDGTGEQGLGLNNDLSGDHEITHGSFIQLDLAALTDPPLTSTHMSFQSGSTTSGETWQVFGTNTAGSLVGATLIDSGTNENLVADLGASILGTYRYLDVTVAANTSGDNILLRELDNNVDLSKSGDPVPEPSSLVLLGSALVGLGFFRRRRKDTAA